MSEEENAELERRSRLMEKMERDAEDSGLAEKLGKVTPDDVVKLQNQREWADDIARGLEDLRTGRVALWDGKLMARLRRMFPRQKK